MYKLVNSLDRRHVQKTKLLAAMVGIWLQCYYESLHHNSLMQINAGQMIPPVIPIDQTPFTVGDQDKCLQ